jgi:hypothetical protein
MSGDEKIRIDPATIMVFSWVLCCMNKNPWGKILNIRINLGPVKIPALDFFAQKLLIVWLVSR